MMIFARGPDATGRSFVLDAAIFSSLHQHFLVVTARTWPTSRVQGVVSSRHMHTPQVLVS